MLGFKGLATGSDTKIKTLISANQSKEQPMSKMIVAALLALLSFSAFADNYVQGYVRSDGTYVPGHYRSSQDNTNTNNYSTQPNVNPYTGNQGSRAQDYSAQANNYGQGHQIHTGPRGGQFYYNDSGKKVYVPKR
jgi:hypothetical protein